MRFLITRTSQMASFEKAGYVWKPPCEEAIKGDYITKIFTPPNPSTGESEPLEMYFQQWFVDLEDMDALLAFVSKYSPVIVENTMEVLGALDLVKFEGYPALEIYDDYRE